MKTQTWLALDGESALFQGRGQIVSIYQFRINIKTNFLFLSNARMQAMLTHQIRLDLRN